MVRGIHAEYVAAGADVITANTFGVNDRKFSGDGEVERVITAGVTLARDAGARYVALDVGPTGALLEPLGTLKFEEAYELFARQVRAGASAGADCVLIETMADLYEAKAAVLAAKENCALPVLCTMTFAEDGRTFLGTDPKTAALTLCSLGVDAVGINCSLGPRELIPLVRQMAEVATAPLMVQANAGLPEIVNGETVFRVTAGRVCRRRRGDGGAGCQRARRLLRHDAGVHPQAAGVGRGEKARGARSKAVYRHYQRSDGGDPRWADGGHW